MTWLFAFLAIVVAELYRYQELKAIRREIIELTRRLEEINQITDNNEWIQAMIKLMADHNVDITEDEHRTP